MFVCARNRLRSPTAEQHFAGWPGVETASAGLRRDADVPLGPELLEWADLVFVMERRHRAQLAGRFGLALRGRRVICLEIPDRFAFMAPELIERLEARVVPHLRARAPLPPG
ncbi:low molecular weight protein tyrosine phosphatase family protein [Luteimonas huabeiensis]|uniref:low molecular weight protein tyrosine phosphatase family protein n=1 Tax=Luteimonas huabeiensis TaxID=1244513 RepID=UPI00191C2F66|nr:phosphotyrosine protein phosphatase [Luteimonas huabeiensis]